MGIKRSYEEAHSADIVLLVYDGSQKISEQEQSVYAQLISQYEHKMLFIQNKSDLPQTTNQLFISKNSIICSSKQKSTINHIESAIEQKIKALFESIESPFLLNQRHYNALLKLESDLTAIIPMLQSAVAYELISFHLQDALATLSELTGKTISEAGMDAVFREFCVGK
jgi:tRNA modification GTPase